MTKVDPKDPIVVVGAGCFGLSTAYHLLKRGFTNVTVLDQAKALPAKDAASTDLNKSKREMLRTVLPDVSMLCSREIFLPGRFLYLSGTGRSKSLEGRG